MNSHQTIHEAAERLKEIQRILARVFKNGGYTRETQNAIRHVMMHAPNEVTDLLGDILAYDPDFPRKRNFVDIWFMNESGLERLSSSEDARLESKRAKLREKAGGVLELEEALHLAESGQWDEETFVRWQTDYWNPTCQLGKESLEKVWPQTLEAYFKELGANLTRLSAEVRQMHLSDVGIPASLILTTETAEGDLPSLFDPNNILFTLCTQVQWDEARSALVLQGKAYYPSVDGQEPLMADIPIPTTPESLSMWNRSRDNFQDEGVREKELLKNLNLTVYSTITAKLQLYAQWQSEDAESMRRVNAILKNDGWTGENYKEQRWYSRYMERVTLVRGKQDIETLLKRDRYDAEKEIADFLKRHVTVESGNSDNASVRPFDVGDFQKQLEGLSDQEIVSLEVEWIERQKTNPRLTPNLGLELEYDELRLVQKELQRRITTRVLHEGEKEADSDKDRIIEIQNKKILEQRQQNQLLRANLKLKNRPSREELFLMADKNRKKNKTINYSMLGKELGRTHKTAKAWCDAYGIT